MAATKLRSYHKSLGTYVQWHIRAFQLVLVGMLCGCVSADPQDRRWRQQLAEAKPGARWAWETRSRAQLTGLPLPAAPIHDRVRAGCIVARDYLLIVGSQQSDFYQPYNDHLYVIQLSSGTVVREMPVRYLVTKLFCGDGSYAAYVGMRYNALRRLTRNVVVLRRFPTGEQIDELDLDSLGLNGIAITRVSFRDGVVTIEDFEGNVRRHRVADARQIATGHAGIVASRPASSQPEATGEEELTPVFYGPGHSPSHLE